MRVIEIAEKFGIDSLRLVDRPDPTPAPGRILVRVGAVALNYRDLLTMQGSYNPRQKLPLVPCSDAAGEVVAVGEGVTRFAPGDRVCPIFAQKWIAGAPTPERLRSTLGGPLDGTLAELVDLDAEGAVRAPAHLDDVEASTLGCAGVTAWNALVTHGGVRAGETVLILGTGGVALFALQFTVLLGARAIVVSSSAAKLERARELGAWKTIDRTATPDWGKTARSLCDGGVDLVVEVGGAGTLAQSVAALRFGGRISLIGNVAGGSGTIDLIPVFMRQIRIQGILVGCREDFEAMNRAVEAARLRPVVDRVFPMAEARAALEHLAAGGHTGKVCVRVSG